MEIRITVVEFEGQRLFECDGVMFNERIGAYSVRCCEGTVLFRRGGNDFDQGRIGKRKIWPDSDRESTDFLGFSREELTRGQDHISNFDARNLEVGDEIIFTLEKEVDFIRNLFEQHISFGWDPFRLELKKRFSYPENWRSDRTVARAVYDRKIAAVREALASGEIKFLNSDWPRPIPEKKETTFEIKVVEHGGKGKKYFSYAHVLFDTLPLIGKFWEADGYGLGGCTIAVYRGRRKKRMCTIGIHEVGTHAATLMFTSWDRGARSFLGNGTGYAGELLAKNFGVGYRLILTAPFEFDLVEGLAEYVSPKRVLGAASILALAPSYEEVRETFVGEEFSFGMDIQWDFSWRARDKVVELVKTGQVTVLEFGEEQ